MKTVDFQKLLQPVTLTDGFNEDMKVLKVKVIS